MRIARPMSDLATLRRARQRIGCGGPLCCGGPLFCYGGADGAPANVVALLACRAKSSGQAVADVRCDADGFIEGEGCAGKHGGAFAGGGLGEEDFFVEAG
jgi:hypothetical protein